MDGSTRASSNREVDHIDEEKHSAREVDVEKGPAEETNQKDDTPRDPNIVDWDGPDDPENPLNWTAKRKVTATVSIALITLLTYDQYHVGSLKSLFAHLNIDPSVHPCSPPEFSN